MRYVLGLLGVVVALAIIPPLLTKRNFLFTAAELKNDGAAPFPLDRKFAQIHPAARRIALRDLAKKPGGLLVNFWATWCPPCLEELPSLELLDRQLKASTDPNLPLLVTVSVDALRRDIDGFFKTLSFTPGLNVLHDPNGDFSASVGTQRFPETYWILPDGTVRYKWLGPQDWLSEPVLKRIASKQK